MELVFTEMRVDKTAEIVAEFGNNEYAVLVEPYYDLTLYLRVRGKDLVDHLWEGETGDVEKALEERLAYYRLRICCPSCGGEIIRALGAPRTEKCQSCARELPLIGG